MIWRTGRRRPRNIYLQLRDEPQTTDPAVAVTLGTDEEAERYARQIVDAMNAQQHGDGNQAAVARAHEQAGRIDATVEESERVSQRAAAVRHRGWDHPE